VENTLPTLISVEPGNGKDYPQNRQLGDRDENRNTTVATLTYRYGMITFAVAVYGSFIKGRKAETLTVKLPPSIPKGITLADPDQTFATSASEAFVAWLKENPAAVATSKRTGGHSVADLLK
jgi:hypothetical protein